MHKDRRPSSIAKRCNGRVVPRGVSRRRGAFRTPPSPKPLRGVTAARSPCPTRTTARASSSSESAPNRPESARDRRREDDPARRRRRQRGAHRVLPFSRPHRPAAWPAAPLRVGSVRRDGWRRARYGTARPLRPRNRKNAPGPPRAPHRSAGRWRAPRHPSLRSGSRLGGGFYGRKRGYGFASLI